MLCQHGNGRYVCLLCKQAPPAPLLPMGKGLGIWALLPTGDRKARAKEYRLLVALTEDSALRKRLRQPAAREELEDL